MSEIEGGYQVALDLWKKIQEFYRDKNVESETLGYLEYYKCNWRVGLKRKKGEVDSEITVSYPRCLKCTTELMEVRQCDSGGYNCWQEYDCPNPSCGQIKSMILPYDLADCQERIRKTERRRIEERMGANELRFF